MRRRPPPSLTRTAVLALAAGLAAAVPAAAGHAAPGGRQGAFEVAAQRYRVPIRVLLGVSYLESRWDAHAGQASSAGGYGPMNLTDVTHVSRQALAAGDARGDDSRPLAATRSPEYTGDRPALRTLGTAADLTGTADATLRGDPAANIAGGAALLADYQRQLGLPASADPAAWYGAVARYSGSSSVSGAREFADEVYATIREGGSRRTDSGGTVTLRADPTVRPSTGQLSRLHLAAAADTGIAAECPSTMDCDFIPAAYQQNSADKGDYGNYDIADRPNDEKIQYIVIHDNEGYYNGTVSWFQNPHAYVSAHYEIRSSDGHVTQMVQNKNVAWQAGNWYINSHSIGIEQEGFAAAGATWYTEPLYRQSAKLVRYLAQRYDIPMDRQHILGHDNVPATTAAGIKNMHWDPGPYWDWNHYMDLVRGHTHQAPFIGNLVAIDPDFATNQQPVTGCDKSGSGNPCTAQGTNFVYLHTAPSADAPLVGDPGLHPGPGTDNISDISARAVAGQRYALAGRHGSWTAIWYLGQKAWFHNPHRSPTAEPAIGLVVTPRHGKDSVPVYGRAYPEATAYDGTTIPVQGIAPLGYSLAPGQRYPLGERHVATDYYYAKTIDASIPDDRTVVRGHDRYYEIQFGHRVAFVRAADVTIHVR